MDSQNPYSSPNADLGNGAPPVDVSEGGARITQRMVDELARTKPWVRLCSVMFFVGSGFMLLGGFAMMVVGGTISGAEGGFMGGVLVGGLYILIALLYLVPALYLFRYANSIRSLVATGRVEDFEAALGHQRAFWRLVGILIIAMLCLYALIVAGLIVAAIFGAFN